MRTPWTVSYDVDADGLPFGQSHHRTERAALDRIRRYARPSDFPIHVEYGFEDEPRHVFHSPDDLRK